MWKKRSVYLDQKEKPEVWQTANKTTKLFLERVQELAGRMRLVPVCVCNERICPEAQIMDGWTCKLVLIILKKR